MPGTTRFHEQPIAAAEIQDLDTEIGANLPTDHALSVLGMNDVQNLPTMPVSPVTFYLNDQRVSAGIANDGQIVSVDEQALGYPITPTDKVVATYL